MSLTLRTNRFQGYLQNNKIPIEIVVEIAKDFPVIKKENSNFVLEKKLNSEWIKTRTKNLPHDMIAREIADLMRESGNYRFVATNAFYVRKSGRYSNQDRVRELDVIGINGKIDIVEVKEEDLNGVSQQLWGGLKELREVIKKFKLLYENWEPPRITTNAYTPRLGLRRYQFGEKRSSLQIFGYNEDGLFNRIHYKKNGRILK